MAASRSSSGARGPDVRRPRGDGHLTTSPAAIKRQIPRRHPEDDRPELPPPLFGGGAINRADWMRQNGVAFLDGEGGPFVARQVEREPGDEAHAIYEVVGPDETCTLGDCDGYYQGSCAEFRANGLWCRHGEAAIDAGLIARPSSWTIAPEGQGGDQW